MNDLPTISLGTNFEDIEMSDREDENLHDQKMEVVNEVSNSESSESVTLSWTDLLRSYRLDST